MTIEAIFKRLKYESRKTSFSSYEKRIKRLDGLRRLVEEQEKSILEALSADLGKSEFEGYLTEIALVKQEIDFAKKSLRKWMRPSHVAGSLAFFWSQSFRRPEPLGLVLIISPWNYPFQLLIAPLIGALAAGNAAVLKPSELAPSVAQLISKLIPIYFEDGEVAVVEGGIEETSTLTSLAFDHIFFTGSTNVGKIIMKSAAANLTPVTLELGGKSPCLLFEKEKFDLSVKRIIWGKFLNCGQTCVAPDYVLLPTGQSELFVASAKKWIHEFYSRDILNAKDYGKIINANHYERLESLIDPEKVLFQMEHNKSKLKLSPVIVKATSNDKVMNEEIFGPILPLVEVIDFRAAINFVNEREKPLAAYLFSSESEKRDQFVEQISAGGVCINDVVVHLTNKNLPFGGVGPSGLGAYHGIYTFQVFSHYKSVMRRSFWWENSLRYFPSGNKLKILKRLLPWIS